MSNNNAALENIAEKITIVNNMKCGQHQAVNNAACYYQTPFNIALISEQVSNHNNVLRERANMEKSAHRIQNNMISEEKILRSRMSAKAKEHIPSVSDEKECE